MKLTTTQRTAIEKVIHWYYNEIEEKSFFVLAGYAGTGKTSIVRLIIDILGLAAYQVIIAAPTGKAVNVLRQRMNGLFSNTIHKTFYHVYRNSTRASFKLKNRLPSTIKLIIVDEFSMVNDKMIEDIFAVAGDTPIIFMGDPGQLPPIFGGNKYIDAPDFMLTEVMRQNDSSGILQLAHMARQGLPLKIGKYGDSKIVQMGKIDPIESYDAVLCWKNSTRIQINKKIRSKLGLSNIFPSKGEKLVCLNNSYDDELNYDGISIFVVNGLGCIATSDADDFDDDKGTFGLKFKPDFIKTNAYFFDTTCRQETFLRYSSSIIPKTEDTKDDMFLDVDFGYALTVHKSQGSEWPNVLIINDYQGNKNDYNKWLYTAITRGRLSITLTNP